jgi:TRAP-type C4-dicarboxylate transport system permease large subunit
LANTSMLGSLLIPEMERRGYKKVMTIGPIIGCGATMLIPQTFPGSSLRPSLRSLWVPC